MKKPTKKEHPDFDNEYDFFYKQGKNIIKVEDRTEDIPSLLRFGVLIEEGLELGCMEDTLESSNLGDTVAGTHGEMGEECTECPDILPVSSALGEVNGAVARIVFSATLRSQFLPASPPRRKGHMFLARFTFSPILGA